MVSSSYDYTARIWDASTGRPLIPPLRHQGEAQHATLSPNGRLIATAARDGTARIWDAQTGQPTVDWMHHKDTVQTVIFHPDGRRLFTRDHTGFRFWDVETGEPVTIHYQDPMSAGIAIDSPTLRELLTRDGKHLFFGCSQDAATLWDIPNAPPGAPAWFPEFLEAVAGTRLSTAGEYLPVPVDNFLGLRERVRSLTTTDYYTKWVRWYLGQAETRPE